MVNAELQLVVAACKCSFDERPMEAPSPHIDWRRLLALANRHRVQALCWNGLAPFAAKMPDEIAQRFRAEAREIVAANLRSAAECARLNRLFGSAGVPLLFIKGLTVGALAYPNPYLKMGVDIDLLVGPERLADAIQVLQSAGYHAVVPASPGQRELGRWHVDRKESVWIKGEGDFQIDLHTRLADHPSMIAGLDVNSPSQAVSVGNGTMLPTLANDQLFAYLCVHGASSAWFRLKWIADLAGLVNGKDGAEIERLYARSQELGAGRAAAQALLLAEKYFTIGIGDDLRSRLAAEPVNRWLVRAAEQQLLNATEPSDRFLGTATIHLSQLGLRPEWRFKLSEAARQIRAMRAGGAQ